MELNSEEILDLITNENLKSKDVKIDFANKKIYVTANRDSIDFLKGFMNENGFEYVGETIKLQYDHNCCECKESFDHNQPIADPIKCHQCSSSSSSSSGQPDDCSPFITFKKYAYQKEGGCFIDTIVIDLDTDCGCDIGGNCTWRTEIEPTWYSVTDLDDSKTYNKLVSGFYQLKVENGIYVFRELIEEVYYPPLTSVLNLVTETQIDQCPCLEENRPFSKKLKINVLKNYQVDFDTLVANWDYENPDENYTFLKLENATNYCNINKFDLSIPTGTYAEDSDLINNWKIELEKQPYVSVSTIEEACDYSSSSSSLSTSSSSKSSTSSNSSSSSSFSSTSSSSKSTSSSSSSSISSDSSTSNSSESSSSSSFDERCKPVIIPGYTGSKFGSSSTFSRDGAYYAVGAPTGKVSIYRVHTPNPPTGVPGYTLLYTIDSPLPSSGFGTSVSFSETGTYLIIGAPNYLNDKGAFFLYKKDIGNSWSIVTTIISPDGSGINISNTYGDNFGKSVDVNSDGSIIIVGAPGHTVDANIYGINAGAVYVYNYDLSTTVTLDQKVYPLDGQQQDRFGWDVSLTDFGLKFIASSYDSDTLGIAAGAAYIFEKPVSTWMQTHKFTASDGAAQDRFGWAVSFAKNADIVAISSYKDTNANGLYAGAVYVYTKSDPITWNETKIISPDPSNVSFGFDVALDIEGTTLAVSQLNYNYLYEPTSGKIYTYTFNGSWSELQQFTDTYSNDDSYGFSISLSRNGNYLGVGAPSYNNAGLSHIYQLSCFGRTLTDSPASKYIVLVSMDGARYTETLGTPANIPSIMSLASTGSINTELYKPAPTETIAGHDAMTTGRNESIPNDGSTNPYYPTFMQEWLYNVGIESNVGVGFTNKAKMIFSKDKLNCMSKCTLVNSYLWNDHLPYVNAGVNGDGTGGYRSDATTHTLFKTQCLGTNPPFLSMVSYASPDTLAHASNYPGYITAIQTVDGYIGEIWNLIQNHPLMANNTTIVITNDHGRQDPAYQNHGGSTVPERHVMFVAAGPNIKIGFTTNTARELRDIPATIMNILGMTKIHSDGTIMTEILNP